MRYSIFFLLATLATAAPRYSVEPFAGSSWVGDGGPSRDSLLLQADGLATDTFGNVFISDAQTHRVRRINPAGIIETVAGTGVAGFSGDEGPATQAQLSSPYGLATDAQGNLYIADLGNHRIRRVSPNGTILTWASGFRAPRNIVSDPNGNLFIADFDASLVVLRLADGHSDAPLGTGYLDHPAGLALGRDGLYIGDTGHHAVWRVQNRTFTKVATASAPTGLAFDSAGNLLIADMGGAAGTLLARDVATTSNGIVYTTDGRLVRRSVGGTTTVIAGRGDPARGDTGLALEARLNNPSGLALDAQGNLYIADRDNHRIRRIDSKGVITTYAGTGLIGNDGDNGPALAASLNQPTTLRIDASGDLYVEDSGNHRVRRISPSGFISSAKSLPESKSPYFIDGALRLARQDPNGAVTLLELAAPITLPTAVIADDSGVLYVADADQDRVWKLTPAPDPISLLRVPDRFAPGMIAFFNGYNFTRPEVVFDNTIATILAHKDASLAVLVPATLQPGPIALDIRDDGVSIARLTGIVTSAAPQLFAAVNEDGSVNTPSNAAARGSILVLYGTGQGLLAPPVTVSIAGYAADVLYSGPVSGFAGLWQVNARVPGGFLSPGQLPQIGRAHV